MSAEEAFFRRCSVCREPIAFEATYFRCSVSTCNRKRMPLYFCSVGCWDAHQADARHRDAGAEETRAPTRLAWEKEQAEGREKEAARAAEPGAPALQKVGGAAGREVLVVTSRLKDYVRERSGMNTSDRALAVLSDHVRELCDSAIAAAGKDGRKTVMERDVAPLLSRGESLATGSNDADDRPDDVLVVVSKLKQYVKARAGMNTSDGVARLLSAHLRRLSRQAIRRAGADDRKTLFDRDYAGVIGKNG